MDALQAKLQVASGDYQKYQDELTSAVEIRQRLDAQLSENELVQKEFKSLKEHNTVYKLIGPVLVAQDQAEAKVNVDKRLEFIRTEINRVEKQLRDLSEKSEKKKLEIVQIQSAAQTLQEQQPSSRKGKPVAAA